ncbi:hypothetical protein K402DRAFT_420747 [Aulographum hederae CBS 113979]|uniref:Uncharacterized protein n=1 Tax=Aulographum hederae CBS 113979 TaxID=1176131 RepID=A0A6G1H279_9PEZI|nr:hypothetical protein K402DRAFT_420747 [Aulographum hederae CBS 113979]
MLTWKSEAAEPPPSQQRLTTHGTQILAGLAAQPSPAPAPSPAQSPALPADNCTRAWHSMTLSGDAQPQAPSSKPLQLPVPQTPMDELIHALPKARLDTDSHSHPPSAAYLHSSLNPLDPSSSSSVRPPLARLSSKSSALLPTVSQASAESSRRGSGTAVLTASRRTSMATDSAGVERNLNTASDLLKQAIHSR